MVQKHLCGKYEGYRTYSAVNIEYQKNSTAVY